jgi:hypothetical protein
MSVLKIWRIEHICVLWEKPEGRHNVALLDPVQRHCWCQQTLQSSESSVSRTKMLLCSSYKNSSVVLTLILLYLYFSVYIHRTTSGFDFQAFFPRYLAVCFDVYLSFYLRRYLFMIRQSVSSFIAFISRATWRVIMVNDLTFIYQFMIRSRSIIRL